MADPFALQHGTKVQYSHLDDKVGVAAHSISLT